MTNAEAAKFAAQWVESFNRKDVNAVLAHFAEDATFRSPQAVSFGARPHLNSREELRTYWTAALQKIGSLHFTLDGVVNDPAERRLVIIYLADIDGNRARAAEIYEFNEASKVIHGEAMYGAPY